MSSSERKQHYQMWGRGFIGFGLIPLVFGLAAFLFNFPNPGTVTSPFVPGMCYYNSAMKAIFRCTINGTLAPQPSLVPWGAYLPYYILMVIGIVVILGGVNYLAKSRRYQVATEKTVAPA